jgi:toxin CcdB
MAQLDVYKNPGPRTSKQAPYLVEVQGRFVDSVTTCVVIPLVCKEYFTGATIFNPVIAINGVEYLLSTAEITAVRKNILGIPVASVQSQRSQVIAAIDRLLQ